MTMIKEIAAHEFRPGLWVALTADAAGAIWGEFLTGPDRAALSRSGLALALPKTIMEAEAVLAGDPFHGSETARVRRLALASLALAAMVATLAPEPDAE